MRVSMFEVAEQGSVLSGAGSGRCVFGALVLCTAGADPEQPIFLDFSHVAVATASFLREAVVRFRDYAAGIEPVRPVVVANATGGVIDELAFFAEATRDALWSCALGPDNAVSDLRLIGRLEPVEAETLAVVAALGEVTAKKLAAQQTAVALTGTAWNNRLAALSNKGLVLTRRTGKVKVYRAVSEGR